VEVMAFLREMHDHLRRKFIVVMDRLNAHRTAVRLLREAGVDWFEVEWLPAYAPDLNPVELVWNHVKYADLANFIPDDIAHLFQEVDHLIRETGKKGHLIRSFFEHTDLEL
jgi:transposase